MRYYIASSNSNINNVQQMSQLLKRAGWKQTYNWTEIQTVKDVNKLREIGQAKKKALMLADLFILLLPGGQESNIEIGMALAMGKPIFLCHQGAELDPTYYHLPEVNIFKGDVSQFAEVLLSTINIYPPLTGGSKISPLQVFRK